MLSTSAQWKYHRRMLEFETRDLLILDPSDAPRYESRQGVAIGRYSDAGLPSCFMIHGPVRLS
jgi:hypothetical protein